MRTLLYTIIIPTTAAAFIYMAYLLLDKPLYAILVMALFVLALLGMLSFYEGPTTLAARNEARKLDLIESGALTEENVAKEPSHKI